ncbi:hypothetical protein RHSIM_Rhsim01G0126600 [Rhododendron simsii]|uniref:Protein DA1-like domain-containing protein n=1 Tax=Rhododendron simsii TaxID=118357 RepID=A0A834HKP3_RHOSS|nr:hypothetical protein RHSIM_Rhsim01G0126600 [Rhododendron simsii]
MTNNQMDQFKVITCRVFLIHLLFQRRIQIEFVLAAKRHRQILGAELAHEMTHAVIKLQDWSFKLEKKVEEGICEAIASEWLEYIVGEYNPSYTQIDAKIAEALTMDHKKMIEEGYFGSCSCYAELWKTKRAIKKYGFKGTLKLVARSRNIPE